MHVAWVLIHLHDGSQLMYGHPLALKKRCHLLLKCSDHCSPPSAGNGCLSFQVWFSKLSIMFDHRKAELGMITFLEHTMELHLQTGVSDNYQEDGCYEMELENVLFHLFTETVLYPWVASNLLCRPGWPWVHSDPPASASQARELQVHATTPCSFPSHSSSLEKKEFIWAYGYRQSQFMDSGA